MWTLFSNKAQLIMDRTNEEKKIELHEGEGLNAKFRVNRQQEQTTAQLACKTNT